MAFESYNKRLEKQLARRDAAKQQAKNDYQQLSRTVSETATDTQNKIMQKVTDARTAVTSRIEQVGRPPKTDVSSYPPLFKKKPAARD